MAIVFFKILPKNTQIRWFQIFFFLVLHEALHIDKSETADFKYDNSFGKLLTKDNFGPKF